MAGLPAQSCDPYNSLDMNSRNDSALTPQGQTPDVLSLDLENKPLAPCLAGLGHLVGMHGAERPVGRPQEAEARPSILSWHLREGAAGNAPQGWGYPFW